MMFYNSYDNIGLVRVLSFLKSHHTEYLSGQDLSDVLKISRAAVWKHIKTIRRLGYKVEARRRLGYQLVGDTDRLLPWEVVAGLDTRRIGKKAYYFDEVESTQDYAVRLARSKGEEGSVVIAERQTHGRGRLQRRWESPDGGIWMSVILRPRLDADALPLVSMAAGVALADAIETSAGIKPKLKWPNDVVIDSKKVAGIIADASIESNRQEYIVVGTGINFDVDSERMEGLLGGTPNSYGVTSIVQNSKSATRLRLIQEILKELEECIGLLEAGRTDAVIKDWMRHSSTIGRKVTALAGGVRITGVAERIDVDGALIIRTPGGTQRVLADDVAHLR